MAMAASDGQELHFVLVPLMAQGHMIPMVDLARLLAERGVLVTLVTTAANLSRIAAVVRRAEERRLPLRFLTLRFPCEEAGLPDGCENVDMIPGHDLVLNFFAATEMLREPLLAHLRRTPPLPSCIVSDMCHPWTRHVARDLGVPRLDFYGMSCFSLLAEHNLVHGGAYEGVEDDRTPVAVPGLPLRVEVTRALVPRFFPGPEWERFNEERRQAAAMSCGDVVNTFAALEAEYIAGYAAARGGRPVWAVGPVSLCNRDAADKASRGDAAAAGGEACLSWLDAMKPRSVLYVSFGTLVRDGPSQLAELGLGLEAARHPFVWVIKAAGGEREAVEGWLAAEGFEERTAGRALIVRGWAPQVAVLSHPAVGGFLTHCGWNSTVEGIAAGVPLITWPGFGDQFLNERFVVDALGVGLPVGVTEPVWDGAKRRGAVVGREAVEKAVNRVMGCGEEAEERRRKVEALSEMGRRAMEAGGSSHATMTKLIDEMAAFHARKKKKKEMTR